MTTLFCSYCGREFPIRVSDVKRGRGRFCGKSCASSGINGNSYRHGMTDTKEYRTWGGAKKRCTNPNVPHAEYYIGRGIKMCDRWFNSFENFLEDMGKAPSPEHSIERINVDGNYEPSNCKWATKIEQMSNTRANKHLTYNGETRTQEDWGRVTGIGGTNICKRIKRGWSIEKALTTPLKSVEN